MKRQKAVRKKLKKQAKEFCPWSGYYMHEMIKTMLEFYHKTYLAKDCCWSEDSRLEEIATCLGVALHWADELERIYELETDELIKIAEKELEFENYLATWSEKNNMTVTDKNRGYLAYDFLEKIYTERFYNIIGKHIWEWCD
jgi:hypothetical protein